MNTDRDRNRVNAPRRAFMRALGATSGVFAVPFAPPASAQAAAQPYRAIALLSPQPDETVHDNRGDLPVAITLVPPLQVALGHRLQLLLDGQPLGPRWDVQRFVAPGIERGEHTLQVSVVASDGTVLIATKPVPFQLWRASRLFSNRVTR